MTIAQSGVYPHGHPPGRSDPVHLADPALPGEGLFLETDHEPIVAGIELQNVVGFCSRAVEAATLTDRVAVQATMAA